MVRRRKHLGKSRFVYGIDGSSYLSHTAAGQIYDSPCIDAGHALAADICYGALGNEFCLDDLTTRTDQITDTGMVDMGFHYPVTELPTPTPTPTPACGTAAH